MQVEGEEEKFHRGFVFCDYKSKRGIKLGKSGIEGCCHLICIHRRGSCNSPERIVFPYNHFFIWENFSCTKSTTLTDMIVEDQI